MDLQLEMKLQRSSNYNF